MEYERDPNLIYARSFSVIQHEVDLSVFPKDFAPLACRMIHSCGMVDLCQDLRYTPCVVSKVREAIQNGGAVLVDVRMVAAAILMSALPSSTSVVCEIDAPRVRSCAQAEGTTRAAVAVRFWRERLSGAVVIIGSAPTALFALLELMDETGIRPAAILATPVGFVGAVESKQELVQDSRGVPFVTLLGRRGGSAMAAAAFNAIFQDFSGTAGSVRA